MSANNGTMTETKPTETPSTALATRDDKIIPRFAEKYQIDPKKLLSTMKATCFRIVKKDNTIQQITDEQMLALMVVSEQYNLNPFTREIYAFPQNGGIVPIVSIDGWARITNEAHQFDGMNFDYGPIIPPMVDEKGNMTSLPCFEYVECTIYRKDHEHPTTLREYQVECARATLPWQQMPRRMLRHKAMIQCARIAFGFAGIYDEEEGGAILANTPEEKGPATIPDNGTAKLRQTKGKTVEAPKEKAAEAQTQEKVTEDGEVVDAEFKILPDVLKEAKDATPPPAAEAPKPPTTRQLEALFRDAQPDHIAFRITKDKEGTQWAKCTCGAHFKVATTGTVTVFEKAKEGDGSCGAPEQEEESDVLPISTFNEETNRLEPEPAKTKTTTTPEDEQAEQIMKLEANDLNQFFEENLKAAGKMNLPDRRKSVTPTIAMIRRKLQLSTSPIQVQQSLQWLVKANFILSMDGERHEKLKAEINAKSSGFKK